MEEEEENEVTGSVRTAGLDVEAACSVCLFVRVCVCAGSCVRTKKDDSYVMIHCDTATDRQH